VTECVSVVETGSEWNLGRQLARVRSHGNRVLERYLNPRRAELAAAVLLGYREELDAGRNEAFLTTGTIHVLSISGLHVGILAAALFWIMRRTRLRRGLAAAAIAVVTVLYALMVDVEPPVVRSTILVLVACTAVWLGRELAGRRRVDRIGGESRSSVSRRCPTFVPVRGRIELVCCEAAALG
jgi:predicted membrane metal-binding protein